MYKLKVPSTKQDVYISYFLIQFVIGHCTIIEKEIEGYVNKLSDKEKIDLWKETETGQLIMKIVNLFLLIRSLKT